MIPYFGSIYDFMNGFLYLEEGNYGQAILSFLSGMANCLDEAVTAKKYVNVSDDMLRSVSDEFDDIAATAWKNIDDYRYALNNGISSDVAKELGSYGIFPSLYNKYLINSGEAADTILDVIKMYPDEATEVFAALEKGIDPGIIKSLSDYDIIPSKYNDLDIVSKQAADTMADAISQVRGAIKTSTEELEEIIPKVYLRENGVVEFEYQNIGRIKFDEVVLLKDADEASLDKWDDFVESKWSETAGDAIDDAQEILIEGTLNLNQAPRNEYAQRVAGRLDRLPTDDGGHLIATRFNGSGSLDNLVPMDSNLNRGKWRLMEDEWAKALGAGKEVSVKIEVVYSGLSQRPTEFIVNYWIDGNQITKIFLNIAGG